MKTKYYLEVKLVYTTKKIVDDEEEKQYHRDKYHSSLFDDVMDCIKFGNDLIVRNKWIEQYPGMIGQRLDKRFGLPIAHFPLKIGVGIWFKVCKLNLADAEEIHLAMNKFNKITP